MLFLGDSVAAGEAVPLAAAFDASDVVFESLAADGGGNAVGPFSEEMWDTLPGRITSADPDVVIYQITTYDWGGEEEQRTAYEKLLVRQGNGARYGRCVGRHLPAGRARRRRPQQ